MGVPDNETRLAWICILTYIGKSSRSTSDLGSLLQVCTLFKNTLIQQIRTLSKFFPIYFLPETLSKFIHLRKTSSCILLLNSVNQLAILPKKLRKCDFRIREQSNLILPLLLTKKFDYATVRVDQPNMTLFNRNGIWYADAQVQGLIQGLILENAITWVVNSITPEYHLLCQDFGCDRLITPDGYTFPLNIHLCNLDDRLCRLLELKPGTHQVSTCDLAMFAFCKKKPAESWNLLESTIIEDGFRWNGRRYNSKTLTFGDLRIPNIQKLVEKEIEIQNRLWQQINQIEYLRSFDNPP